MITPIQLLRRLQAAWRLLQARRLIAGVNRRQARRAARRERPGYDELRHPAFVAAMTAAITVLVIDVRDAWPAVVACLVNVAGG